MSDPKINLKTPWIAGVLTFLLPGAGQIYQGRYFKGVLFLVCILGTFLYGMQLGEWRPVYLSENPGRNDFGRPGKRNFGFLAQMGLGVPALVAFGQYRRYHRLQNQPTRILRNQQEPEPGEERPRLAALAENIDAPFEGRLYEQNGDDGYTLVAELKGQITLEPKGQAYVGSFRGTETRPGGRSQDVELELGGELVLDSRILGNPKRALSADVSTGSKQSGDRRIVGDIPRGFANWFCAPLDDAVLQDMNRRLNKRFEMALVYTWIAGLLNILAIWDAVSGPAYGYKEPEKAEPEPSGTAGESGPEQNTGTEDSPVAATASRAVEAAAVAEVKPGGGR